MKYDLESAILALRNKIPHAELRETRLPLAPEIRLFLLDKSYPQQHLTSEEVENLMESPPYWAFCWASGQALARLILGKPAIVADKTVIDFGCGSAVVGIAAAKAGAGRVIAIDEDPSALCIAQANAALNKVNLSFSLGLNETDLDRDSVIMLADVFYDRDNLLLLSELTQKFSSIWVADSRVQAKDLAGVKIFDQFQSHTVPDLAEAADFNQVRVYNNLSL